MRCFALLFSFLCLIGTNEVYDFLYVFFCACIAQQALLPSCKHFSPALKDKKRSSLKERLSTGVGGKLLQVFHFKLPGKQFIVSIAAAFFLSVLLDQDREYAGKTAF